MKVTKAVIPAAGFGTRFLPATKAVPKEMLPIVDKPTIQYIVEEAIAAGIEDLIIITSRGKDALVNHFDKAFELETVLERDGKEEMLRSVREVSDKINVHFVRQQEQKGLGHAVLCAKSFIGNEPFAVMLGDDVVVSDKPCIGQLMEQFEKYSSTVLGVQKVGMEHVSKYGIVDCENVGGRLYKVNGMVEKPKMEKAPSDVAVLGRYVITPAIFECLEKTPKGAGGEIQLTDALVMLSESESVYAYDFEGKRYDIGNKQGFLQATVEFALARDDLRDEFSTYLKEIAKSL
ncbi:MAG: UTP--glucose-1-phosphate uridylyltransferase GalU [Hominilimicola sp.]